MLKTEGGMGLLWYTGQPFANTTIRVVFKTASPNANSGVYIRFPEKPKDPWYAVHNGYEVQIDAGGDEWHCTGSIYSLSKVSKRNQKPAGEWNTMDITLDGQKTIVRLNGEVIDEFAGIGHQEVPPRTAWYEPVRGPWPDSGYIGLQNHDGRSTVYFADLYREMRSARAAVPPRALAAMSRYWPTFTSTHNSANTARVAAAVSTGSPGATIARFGNARMIARSSVR